MTHVTNAKINLRHYLYFTFSLIILKPFFIIQYINSDIEKKKENKLSCWHQDPEMLPFSRVLTFKKIHTLI